MTKRTQQRCCYQQQQRHDQYGMDTDQCPGHVEALSSRQLLAMLRAMALAGRLQLFLICVQADSRNFLLKNRKDDQKRSFHTAKLWTVVHFDLEWNHLFLANKI